MGIIGQLAAELESHLPELARRAENDGFARDVYESVEYWCGLAKSAAEGDTRVNYHERSDGQIMWLSKLELALADRSPDEQRLYGSLFKRSAQLLNLVGEVETPRDGHMGLLRIIRSKFRFLQTDFNFTITREEPTCLQFSSGAVYVRLEYATKSYLSCQFGPEPQSSHFFCIEDLLYLHDDGRYRSVPVDLGLKTSQDLDVWFGFLADVFKRYGQNVLKNEPGAFDRLTQAQNRRDAEYVAAMNAKFGGGQ